MFSKTPEHRQITDLLTTYHNLYEGLKVSGFEEIETPFYVREQKAVKRELDRLGIFFYHIPLFGQRYNDCWYVACQKIVWYHLEKSNLLAEWENKPALKDGRLNPLQVWERNVGLGVKERYVLEKFGFRPVPRPMFQLVQETDYKCRWLPSDHPQQIKEVYTVSRLKKITCTELRENLETFGPLWVSLFRFGSANNHATVIVGVGQDCVILNDSSRSRKQAATQGRLIVLTIDDFNKYLNADHEHPIWCYPMQWNGVGPRYSYGPRHA